MKTKKVIEADGGVYTIINNTVVLFNLKTSSGYYTGKALLCPGDIFDEKKGMKIARYRALVKYKKHLIFEYEMYARGHYYCELSDLKKLIIDHCKTRIKKLRLDIKKLMGVIQEVGN